MDAVFFEDGSNIFVAAVPAQGFCMGMLTSESTILCMGDQCSVNVEYNTYNLVANTQVSECAWDTIVGHRQDCKTPLGKTNELGTYNSWEEYEIKCGGQMQFMFVMGNYFMTVTVQCSACNM